MKLKKQKKAKVQNLDTSNRISIKKAIDKKSIKAKDWLFHATPLSKKKWIVNQYNDYYDDFYFYQKEETGIRFINWENVKSDDNSKKIVGKRLKIRFTSAKYDANGKKIKSVNRNRSLRFFCYFLTFIFSILDIAVGLALFFSIDLAFYSQFWFYLVPILVWSVTYSIYFVNLLYEYNKEVYEGLESTLKTKHSYKVLKVNRLKENLKKNSENYFNYDIYKNECTLQTVYNSEIINERIKNWDGQSFLNYNDKLRCYVFDPKFIKNPNGNGYIIDYNSRLDKAGYFITSWDLFHEDDINLTKQNGYIPKSVWDNQSTLEYRNILNGNKNEGINEYNNIPLNDRMIMREAVLLSENCHACLIAGTGKGKTGNILLPLLICLMFSKDMPSIFFNSKGDDANYLYKWSVVCAYRFFAINMMKPAQTDKYNPLNPVYQDVKTMYELKKGRIKELNEISVYEYNQAFNFSIRFKEYLKHLPITDNMIYADSKNYFTVYSQSLNPKSDSIKDKYFFTPTQILNGIMEITKDYKLQEDLFSDGVHNLNEMDVDSFTKYLLANYASRTNRPEYVIGKITRNQVQPYIIDDNMFKNWIINDGMRKIKHWYLVGNYAFSDYNYLILNSNSIASYLKAEWIKKMKSCMESLLVKSNDSAGDYWFEGGKNIFYAISGAFFIGLMKYGPKLFAEEYCTMFNLVHNCDILENEEYSSTNKALNEKLKIDKTKDPYSKLKSYCDTEDLQVFNGFTTISSRSTENWSGLTSSRKIATANLSSLELFKATCYSSISLANFFYEPTFIYCTHGREEGENNDTILTKLILQIFNNIMINYYEISAYNENKSPRVINFILDEFNTVPFTDKYIQFILIDGRALNLYVLFSTQTKTMLTEKPHDAHLLDKIRNNAYVVYSLGDRKIEDAKEDSELFGTYMGDDYSDVMGLEDTAKHKPNIKELPYASVQELLSASNGKLMGLINTSVGTKYMEFRNLLYYSSQMRYMIDNSKYVPNIVYPVDAFSNNPDEFIFDYVMYILDNFNSISADSENLFKQDVFSLKWTQRFGLNNNLTPAYSENDWETKYEDILKGNEDNEINMLISEINNNEITNETNIQAFNNKYQNHNQQTNNEENANNNENNNSHENSYETVSNVKTYEAISSNILNLAQEISLGYDTYQLTQMLKDTKELFDVTSQN